MGFCRRSLETTSLYPPVADTARWFRESVPVSMPQRGWRSADTTGRLSAAIGRKLPSGGKIQKHPNKIAAPPPCGGGAVIS